MTAEFGDASKVSHALREKAIVECRHALGGIWMCIPEQDISIKPITGGLSNYLYLCSLPKDVDPINGEPRHILLRIYGQILVEHPDTMVLDSVIFALMSEKKLGPKLYGVFTGGRLEEYIPARCLLTEELHIPVISLECAKRMARIHQLHMPLCKEPTYIWDAMKRWLDESLNEITFDQSDVDSTVKFNKLLSYNLAEEYECLKETLAAVHSPVVFCHNDMQEGNILFMEDEEPGNQLLPIDFEYAGYNYRGFDIGNHFCEWSYSYKNDRPPYYHASLADYPSRDQQLLFIREYIRESGIENDNGETEEKMLLEVNTYALASHFMWTLWSIVQTRISHIQFGYLDYALARIEGYFWLKDRINTFSNHQTRKQ
ncbi:unnamed protein product [Owenia fusiformis]|uniref:Uncharacterized protein n=1 Tax=Owenia fusiformis TaxID=6347 RepID=A0A8J1XUZ9_OWEFU|nr:unnamed protein product [Owenia fusiformis]